MLCQMLWNDPAPKAWQKDLEKQKMDTGAANTVDDMVVMWLCFQIDSSALDGLLFHP